MGLTVDIISKELKTLVKRKEPNRLKEIRTAYNFKQDYVATELNVAQNTYSRYEAFTFDTPTQVLLKLSKLFNTSIDYILCRTDDNTPYENNENFETNNLNKSIIDRLNTIAKKEKVDINELLDKMIDMYSKK